MYPSIANRYIESHLFKKERSLLLRCVHNSILKLYTYSTRSEIDIGSRRIDANRLMEKTPTTTPITS